MLKRMLWVLLALALPFGVQAAAAQQRDVTGTVTGPNGEGIGGAAVSVAGTTRGVRTDAQGRFTIPVGTGDARLRVSALTYRPREVTVPAGQSSVAVRLETDALGLETVVVTGQATAVRRENLAHDVAVVSARQLVGNAPAQTLDRALQGKVAGATIRSNSGAPGGGVQIRLRGPTTITGNSTPLYVVDGVIVSDVGIAGGQNTVSAAARGVNASNQDVVVNRIADINPNDIENVEILKGASAASIYGSRAAAGVVVITTKRGRSGAPRFSASQRVGYAELSNQLGSRTFTRDDAIEAGYVTAANAATYFNPDGSPKATYDLERQVFGRKAPQRETTLGISGGSESTQYYASGLIQDDQGIAPNTGYLKQSLNLSLNQTLGSRARLSANTNVVHSVAARGVSGNDNTSASYVSAISFTPSFFSYEPTNGIYPRNPFTDSNPLETAELSTNNEDVWRVIGSLNLNLDLMKRGASSLRLVATGGADYFNQQNRLYYPPSIQLQPVGTAQPGTAVTGGGNNLNVNSNVNLVHALKPESGAFSATTSAGLQYEDRDLNLSQVTGRFLLGSLGLPYQAAVQVVNGSRQRTRDFGGYMQEEVLLFNDALSVTGSVRGDRSSNNADQGKYYFYPKAAAAYAFPSSFGPVDQLKLRAAYGASGNEPTFGVRFTPLSVANIEGAPNLAINGGIGADDLRPERVTEIEGGFDATLLDSRAQLTVTMYRRNITNLLLSRVLAPSTGYTVETFNGGSMRSVGQEISLQATPVQRGMFSWNTNTTFTRNRTKVTSLPVPEFSPGNSFGNSFGGYRIAVGYSPTTVFAQNGRDTSVPGCSGTSCPVKVEPIGESEPSFQMGFQNDMKLGRFTLGSLFDWSHGGLVINLTRNYYDSAATAPDYVMPGATPRPWTGCASCLSGEERLYWFNSPNNYPVYVEDASFVKLRELSLSYDVPTRLVGRRVSSAQLQLSARNLKSWDNYSGYDPEVSNFGNVAAGRNQDVTPFPPSRTFWLGINLVF